MKKLIHIYRKVAYKGNDPAYLYVRIAHIVLIVFFLLGVFYLIDGEKPWKTDFWERYSAGEDVSLDDTVVFGEYFADVINTLLFVALFFTAKWWARRLPSPLRKSGELHRNPPIGAKWFWILVCCSMLLSGALRWNLANGSLWWDETWQLNKAVMGEYEFPDLETGEIEYKDRDWQRTFFYYKKPTNHIPVSVLARASLNVWRTFTGKGADEFNEFFYRLPVYLSGFLSVMLIAVFLRDMGFPIAGVIAAFALAIHPWHIRYSVDARAFGFVLAFTMLALVSLYRGIHTGKWKWWLLFGLSQFLLIWSFLYAIFLCALLFLAGAIAILIHGKENRRLLLVRLTLVNVFAAMCWMQVFLPMMPQIENWQHMNDNNMIGDTFVHDLWAGLISGMPYETGGPGSDSLPATTKFSPWSGIIAFYLTPALCVVGLIAVFVRKRAISSTINTALAVAAPVALLFAYISHHYFYTRYLIYGMLAILILCAVAIDSLARVLGGRYYLKASWTLLILATLCFAWYTHPQRSILLSRPISPNRDVAHFIADLQQTSPKGTMAVGFNLGGRMPRAYNPNMHWADDLDALKEIIAKSVEQDMPLVLYLRYHSFNAHDEPDAFPYLNDREMFVPIKEFHGIEPAFYTQVFKYTGKPLK